VSGCLREHRLSGRRPGAQRRLYRAAVAAAAGDPELHIPYAASLTEAVRRVRADRPLFARPDPAGTAQRTQPCGSKGASNSLMPALLDMRGGDLTGRAPGGTVKDLRVLSASASARCCGVRLCVDVGPGWAGECAAPWPEREWCRSQPP
jgi:hypothetical protein